MHMTRDEIISKVMELAAEHGGVEARAVTLASHFVNDLHFDSLTAVEFTMDLEDVFEISISDEQAQSLQTVEQVVDHLVVQVKDEHREKTEG
jgi:acyl carrier protein